MQIARRCGRGRVGQFRQGRVIIVVIDEVIDGPRNTQTGNGGQGGTDTATGQSRHCISALAVGQPLKWRRFQHTGRIDRHRAIGDGP